MNDKKISKTKLLAVFATTTLIFFIGITLGNYFSDAKLNQIMLMERDLRTDMMAVEVQDLLFTQDPCSISDENPLTEELYMISERLAIMENELGPKNPTVLSLKEYTSLLEIKHWLFLKKVKEECNRNYTFILYFYSNVGGVCPKCEEQGYVLTHLRKKFTDLRIYSFDIDIENVALDTFKDFYKVEGETPILVIDDKSYSGFKDKNELEAILFPHLPE